MLDLYSGVGVITLSIAEYVKKIYGIEIERSAVKRAIKNSCDNGIDNAYFFAGTPEKHIGRAGGVNKIIADPPRAGMSESSIKEIEKMRPERLVYVSCYPAAFFRDIKRFSNLHLRSLTLVDMFPQTSHFEIVGLLQHR